MLKEVTKVRRTMRAWVQHDSAYDKKEDITREKKMALMAYHLAIGRAAVSYLKPWDDPNQKNPNQNFSPPAEESKVDVEGVQKFLEHDQCSDAKECEEQVGGNRNGGRREGEDDE